MGDWNELCNVHGSLIGIEYAAYGGLTGNCSPRDCLTT